MNFECFGQVANFSFIQGTPRIIALTGKFQGIAPTKDFITCTPGAIRVYGGLWLAMGTEPGTWNLELRSRTFDLELESLPTELLQPPLPKREEQNFKKIFFPLYLKFLAVQNFKI